MDELESAPGRILRIAGMIGSLDLAPLAHAVWLRLRRLEFGHAELVSPEYGHSHQHSGGPALSKVLRSLDIPSEAVALDLGVGMGIAALTLSRYFNHVIGVELSPELVRIAERNLEKIGVKNVEIHCGDARSCTTVLDAVSHVYMFNPFPHSVMSSVVRNLRDSIARVPRRLTVIYKFPTCHETLVKSGLVETRRIHFRHSHPFAIYELGSARGEGRT